MESTARARPHRCRHRLPAVWGGFIGNSTFGIINCYWSLCNAERHRKLKSGRPAWQFGMTGRTIAAH
jgi:hypothetical protein